MNDVTAVKLEVVVSAEEINRLFQLVNGRLNHPIELGRRERWIFEQVLGESDATFETLWMFLKDVTTCPPEVIAYCQKYLAPKAPATNT